jgi:hypothetical protein
MSNRGCNPTNVATQRSSELFDYCAAQSNPNYLQMQLGLQEILAYRVEDEYTARAVGHLRRQMEQTLNLVTIDAIVTRNPAEYGPMLGAQPKWW